MIIVENVFSLQADGKKTSKTHKILIGKVWIYKP
jgi:hypothetical protein